MPLRPLLLACVFVFAAIGSAQADLGTFLANVNLTAEADFGGFKAQLGTRFDVPVPTVEAVLKAVESPAEAAVLLWLGEQSGKPVETVVQTYRAQKGQGWGAIAQGLGIKPGSPAFHRLKQGDLGWQPANSSAKNGGKGKGKK